MDEKNLIVKSNKLNEARYRLSIQEQRIVLALLSQINADDKNFKTYSFAVKDFIELFNLSGESSYSHLKTITRQLLSKTFIIPEPDGDLQINWLNSVKYYDKEGRFDLSFSAKLKPYLLRLKKEFTRYQLHNIIRLKSVYSVRIYELLKQYQSIGSRYFELTELRILVGLPEGKLKLFGDFKRRVLEVAFRELDSTDINFTYTPVKHVRRVVGVQFQIYSNEKIVKKSKKKKKKIIPGQKNKEIQLELDLKNKQQQALNDLLEKLESDYSEKYQKLKKQAKKRLKKHDKNKLGIETTIKFKMQELLSGFIEKEKINI